MAPLPDASSDSLRVQAADDQTSDAPMRQSSPPPLRIHHILVATGVAAVLLSLHQALRMHDVIGLSEFFRSGHGIAYTVTTALACSLVLFGFWWNRAGRTFFHQPGHWLLISQSLPLGVFLFAAVGALVFRKTDGVPYGLWMLWFLGIHFIASAVCFTAAFRVADTKWWRLLFIIAGTVALIMAASTVLFSYYLYIYGYWLGGIATTVLLLAAAISDRRARRFRDWPHWAGVGLELTLSAAALAQLCWQIYITRDV